MIRFTDTQKLACDISRNIAITAGAGSGKTSVLVERYLWCLRNNGYKVPRIVAITFTEKAAGEMRGRIRDRIMEHVTSAFGDIVRWGDVLEHLPLANIATIHSFCQRVLKEFPLEAHLDPNFDVLDESTKRILLHQLIDTSIQEGSERHDPALAALAEMWSPYALKYVILELIEQRTATLPWADHIQQEQLSGYLARIERLVHALKQKGVQRLAASQEWQQAIQTIQAVIPAGDTSKLTARSLNVLEYDREFRTQTRLDDQLLTLQMLYKDCRMVTPSARWKEDDRNIRLKEAFQTLKTVYDLYLPSLSPDGAQVSSALETSGFHLQQALANLFERVYARYQEEKTSRGVLDFDDLQEKALSLLRQPDIQAILSQRYDYVMIDEFQDTNQLQWELIQRLGTTPQGVSPNTFCVVGDEKQSIYMFRGADVAVFHEVRQELQRVNRERQVVDTPPHLPEFGEPPHIQETQKSGELVMAENFRSWPPVLFFLNYLFAHIFLPAWDDERPFHVPHQELRPGHKASVEKIPLESGETEQLAPVEFLFVAPAADSTGSAAPAGEGDPAASRIPLTEPALLALRIRELSTSFRYADMAILLRTRTRLKEFEEALRQYEIPFVVAGGIGFFQQQELYDIANLLRVLTDPRQDIALAGVLRSPLLGFSDDQLLFLRLPPDGPPSQPATPLTLWQQLAYHAAHPEGIPPELSPEQVAYAHQALTAWQALANRIPITHVLRRILDDTGFHGIIAGDRQATQTTINLEKLLDLARNFEQEGFQTLSDFVGMLDHLIELEERESEAQLNFEGMDAVRLMTIHAAKGLEFPVVFVPELERPFNYGIGTSVYVDLVAFEGAKQPVVGLKGVLPDGSTEDTVLRRYVQRLNHEKTDAEMQRLLYVACTRAAGHLILSGDLSKNVPASSWMAWLLDLLPIQESLPQQELTISDASQTFYDPGSLTIPIRTSGTYAAEATVPEPPPELPPIFSTLLAPQPEPPSAVPGDRQTSERVHTILHRNFQPLRQDDNPYFRISPSTIQTLFQCPHKYYYQHILNLPEYADEQVITPESPTALPDQEERHAGGKERGILLHRLFEEQIFDSGQSDAALLSAAHAILNQMGIPVRTRRAMDLDAIIVRAAHSYRQTGLRDLLARSSRIQREYAFFLRTGRLDISGTLDVLFWDSDRQQWTILDYKSNEIRNDQVQEEIKRHRYDMQMQLYALAVSRIFQVESLRSLIFFTFPGHVYDAVDLSPTALESLSIEIENRLEALLNDSFTAEDGELPCEECGYRVYGDCLR